MSTGPQLNPSVDQSGGRRWGDIKPGDKVLGPDGHMVEVLATRYYTQQHYCVRFDDRSEVEVSEEHEWKVRGRQERRNGLDSWRIMTTREILDAGVKRPNGEAMARQWEIPIQKPVIYDDAPLPVDPYTYGVWLGDGTKANGQVTNPDPEVWENVAYRHKGEGLKRVLYGLITDLKACGLHGQTAYTLAVDERYKNSNQRLALLQGLLDTDGWVEQCGSAAFCSASRQLTKDVVDIARSLGLKARKEKFKPNEKAGAWFTHITWDGKTTLFRVKRKQEKLIHAEHRYQCRWIDSIEPTRVTEGMCIQVPGGLYLAPDYIVTHNSALVAWSILFIMSTRPHSKGVVTANTAEQLRTKTWAELGKWFKKCITSDWFNYFSARGNLSLQSKQFPESWRCDALTCREENSESFAGLHAANSTPWYIFDEASAVPDQIWNVSEGGTTDGEPVWLAFGNPTQNTGRFYQAVFGSQRHRWKSESIDSRDVKITNKDRIQEWVDDYGEDSDFVRVRVRGVPPTASTTQFLPVNLVRDARKREPTADPGAPVIVGVDVARFGDDHSVICTRIGRDAKSIPMKKFTHQDTQDLGFRVMEHVEWLQEMGYGCDVINVDGGGVGGGVIDKLRACRYNCNEVHFGGKAEEKKKYANRGTEMWDRIKFWIPYGCIPDTEILEQELVGREYGFVQENILMLEKKSDMKKRGLPSPDHGDALALTFAVQVARRDTSFGRKRMFPRMRAVSEYDIYDGPNDVREGEGRGF